MARPKKKSADKASKRLPPVRCTEAEYASIQARAAQAQMTLAAFMRQMALTGEIVVTESKYDFETVQQLRRIGVNLNQLTMVSNATGELQLALHTTFDKLNIILDHVIENF